jgi:hypothetical protein
VRREEKTAPVKGADNMNKGEINTRFVRSELTATLPSPKSNGAKFDQNKRILHVGAVRPWWVSGNAATVKRTDWEMHQKEMVNET